MSLLSASCHVLVLTLVVLAAEVRCDDGYDIVVDPEVDSQEGNERVKRQRAITISIGSQTLDPQRRTTTILIQGVSSNVAFNDPRLIIEVIDEAQTVGYQGSVVTITNNDTSVARTFGGVSTFTFIDTNVDISQFSSGQTFFATSGPGVLFVEGSSALFSKEDQINNAIMRIIPQLPAIISPVEVIVAPRQTAGMMNLVLNIDDSTDPPDGVPTPTDDVIELTGSSAFVLSNRDSVSYTGNTILIARGNQIVGTFPATSFSTLSSLGGGNLQFSEFNSFNRPSGPVSGPGVLRTGTQGGQSVAFFTSVASINNQIGQAQVDMQLEFRVTNVSAEIVAAFPPMLAGQRLVMLNGAQSFTYPDATNIQLTGTSLNVLSGSRLLQRFDTGTTPTLSAFLNHQVTRRMTDDILRAPDGGVTLFFNMGDNEAFVYPARNQFLAQNITQAQEAADIVQVDPTARYTFQSDQFGTAILRAQPSGAPRPIDVVQLAPGARVFSIGSRQSISYKGMSIDILDESGMSIQTIMQVSPLTVNTQDFNYITNNNSFVSTFGGPGTLYIDPDMMTNSRAFYSGSARIQTAITNFVNGLPEPRLDIRRDRLDGNVYIRSGTMNLLNLNGASGLTAGSNLAGIYFNDDIILVNSFDIPSNARALYTTANGGRVRVPDPANPGMFLFDIPSGMMVWEFDGMTSMQLDLTMARSFPFLNGLIYFSDRGALVARTDAINPGVVSILRDAGSLQADVQNIRNVTSLTVADGRSIVMYSGMAPIRLPRGGSYYISADGNSAMYVANAGFNMRLSGIYSQLNPSKSFYNETTGMIVLTTFGGDFISSLIPGTTMVRNVDRIASLLYENDTIFFLPERLGIMSVMNVGSFIVWDGLTVLNFTSANDGVNFPGPGIFWFQGGMAFFTADPTTINLITQRIANVMGTFRSPILSSTPRTFRDKFNTVRGGFSQTITVYESADVSLDCTILAAIPPAMVVFQRRLFNTTSMMFFFETIMDGDNAMITQNMMGTTFTLTISNIGVSDDNINTVNDTGVFRCVASNSMGSQALTTTVNVLPPEAPAIVTGYLPPLDFLNSTRDRLITIRQGDDMDQLNFINRSILIFGPPSTPGVVKFDDELLIVRRIHVGCKGEGLPKARITWYEVNQDPGTPITGLTSTLVPSPPGRIFINDTERNDVLITVPRQGRSVLTVDLDPQDSSCRRYICEATNAGGTAYGGVDICPRYYGCEAGIEGVGCSGTCGIGVEQRRYTNCNLVTDGSTVTIPYEAVPFGLFPLSPVLCGFGRDPCPVITFQFMVESATECSVTCGSGFINQTIVCLRIETVGGTQVSNETVDDDFCQGQSRPAECIKCENPPCPFWRTGRFGPCSSTCRGGMRMRDVFCVQALHNETTFEPILDADRRLIFVTVDDNNCTNTSMPEDTASCNDHINCPIRWRPQPWGLCPTTGDRQGCQERDVVCEIFDRRDYLWPGTTVNDSVCEDLNLPRPHCVRNCQGFVCSLGGWSTMRSACSVTCGRGFQTQTIFCLANDTGLPLKDGFCDIRARPKEHVECSNQVNCCGVCDFEPNYCQLIRLLRSCDSPAFEDLVEPCCKSCPKPAAPVPCPVTVTEDLLVTGTPDQP